MPDPDRRWLKNVGSRDRPPLARLLCFHHAGGSAAVFRSWPHLLPSSIEPVAVQLPGRADRFNEPPHEQMDELLDELVEVIEPILDRPIACYGVSMGARIAWSLAHALRARGLPGPTHLFIACDAAPSTDSDDPEWDVIPGGLEAYVRRMGGTPPEILAEPRLLAALLRTLRADLDVFTSHDRHPTPPLGIPIRAFAGRDDPDATPERMAGWRAETTGPFALDVLPSGHFFDDLSDRHVAATIGRDLEIAATYRRTG